MLRRRKQPDPRDLVVRAGVVKAVTLRCGHVTKLQPLAVLGTRRLFVCPEGCEGLQEPRAR